MTVFDYLNRQTPDYYTTMYLEGYQPHQIFAAAHRAMIEKYTEPKEETEIIVNSEVNVR